MMVDTNKPLRIFVAMPGSDMGTSATWKDPEQIKKYFFLKIGEELQKNLKHPIELVIEKDKVRAGSIYSSMFKEAWEADIYIADLTGNNPNVYLELGVRWAVKDKVTIIVSQDVSSIRFNAASNRAIPYSNDPGKLSSAVEQVVKAIQEDIFENGHIDSPVRQDGLIVTIPKEKIASYTEEIARLEVKLVEATVENGKKYLISGKEVKDPEVRIDMFRRAIEANKTLMEAYLLLGIELNKVGDYEDAISVLKNGVTLRPDVASLRRELGLAYTKLGQLDEAAKSLQEAVSRDEKDSAAWSNLGGVLRRLGTKDLPQCRWDILLEARASYNKALTLDNHDHYSQGNVARLDLLLSKVEPTRRALALDGLDTLRLLCNIQIKRTPGDYWLTFDLADSYLLSNYVEKGFELYQKAIQLVPTDYKVSVLSSVAQPLREFVALDLFDQPIAATIQKIFGEIDALLVTK